MENNTEDVGKTRGSPKLNWSLKNHDWLLQCHFDQQFYEVM